MKICLPSEPQLLSPLDAAELLAAVAGPFSATEWWIALLRAVTCNQIRYRSNGSKVDCLSTADDPEEGPELHFDLEDLGSWLKKLGHSVSYQTD